MKKNLYQGLSLAAFCLLVSSSLLLPAVDHSVSVGESSSLVSLIKDAVIEKAQVALEGLSAFAIQRFSTGEGKDLSFKDVGALLLKMRKYVLADLTEFESVTIDNGILILSPGSENSVRYLATPEQKKRVTCKTTPRGGVHLGFAGGVRGERLVVFVGTYVPGSIPRIIASERAQVFVRSAEAGRLFNVQLSGAARCVAQDVSADEVTVKLVGDSSFSSATLSARALNVAADHRSQVNLVGCNVSGKTTVHAKGSGSVRLQGATRNLEAHALGAEFDSSLLRAEEVTLFPAKTAKSIVVHAVRKLDAFPVKKGLRSSGYNEALVVEYIGNPEIQNSSGVVAKKVKDPSSLLSRLGSGEGVARNGADLMQDVRKVVGDAMKVASAFLDIVAR